MRRSLSLKLVLTGLILILAAFIEGAINTVPHVEALISNSVAEHQEHSRLVTIYLFWGGAATNCLGVLGLLARIFLRGRLMPGPEL
jgi:hypothetical protein